MKHLIIPDTHHPFTDKEAMQRAADIADELQPDYIEHVGDLYDLYSWSKFQKNPNFITPEREEALGRQDAECMWKLFQSAAPKAKCIQLSGNHDLRPVKYIEGKEAAYHVIKRHIKELMTFKGVTNVEDEWEVDGIVFQHGFEKAGMHAYHNQQNTVVGHSHRPGLVYHRNKHGPFWELNVGCMVDFKSEAFSYRDRKKVHKFTVGIGAIDELGPRFVAL